MSNLKTRVVITGVGLTSPIGDNLKDFRANLLAGKSGVASHNIRYMGAVPAGFCHFEETKYQKRRALRRGTRAGSIAIYCAHESLNDAGIDIETLDKTSVGVFIGITEHGNVETENEIYELHQNEMDTKLWSHHHNPRTVANNPAGEVTLNLGITGPHYTVGAACAGGNAGIIQGVQQLLLGECDVALAGGVSESPHTFGIFAAFASQGALADAADGGQACRPLDQNRKGIAISEGGCLYTLERFEDAKARGAKIYGEVVGYAINSDATDFVNPNHVRQAQCMQKAMERAGLTPEDIDIVSMHATGTGAGDIAEVAGVREVFANSSNTKVNFTKGHIGHSMGAAGALELAGNLPSFEDGMVHPGINVESLDPDCRMDQLVLNQAQEKETNIILNNSFGMLGINSAVIIKKYQDSLL
jgi:3-oxoacyl-[acyl-carrier-protein] synthase II